MSTHPPLSDAQMGAVLHGTPVPAHLHDTELVDRAMATVQVLPQGIPEDRMGSPRISGYLDRDAPATIAGYMAVAEREPHGWYAVRETHGGGQGMWAATLEEALAKLRDAVARSVAYWVDLVGMDPARVVRMGGEHYVMGVEQPRDLATRRGSLGFGGHRWELVRLDTGQHVVSHNLWRQGVIPVEFRPFMPDTHRLAGPPEGPEELHSHYVLRTFGEGAVTVVERPLVTKPTEAERRTIRAIWDGLA